MLFRVINRFVGNLQDWLHGWWTVTCNGVPKTLIVGRWCCRSAMGLRCSTGGSAMQDMQSYFRKAAPGRGGLRVNQ